jgi:hypothetical protein
LHWVIFSLIIYNAVADVILGKVLTSYADRDELDEVMSKVVGFL